MSNLEIATEIEYATRVAIVVNMALENKDTSQLAFPHAEHLTEIITPWVDIASLMGEEAGNQLQDLKPWTADNWSRIITNRKYSAFRDYFYSRRVAMAIEGEIDFEQLIFGEAGVTYRTLHYIEKGNIKDDLSSALAALGMLPDRRQQRIVFCSLFFLLHYYSDSYLPSDDLTEPVLAIWQKVHEDKPKSAEYKREQALLTTLRTFNEHYPVVFDYKGRVGKSKRNNWKKVRDCLNNLVGTLNFDFHKPDLSVERKYERYLKAILMTYYAEARQYANIPLDSATQRVIFEAYAGAGKLFEQNEDDFHAIWVLFEEADSRAEFGGKENYENSRRLCLRGINRTLRLKRNDLEEEVLDNEVLAGFFRILSDIKWANNSRKMALGLLATALFTAYVWNDIWTQQGEEYAYAFYKEQIERTLDRLEEWVTDDPTNALEGCEFLRDFLEMDAGKIAFSAELLIPFNRQMMQEALFPAVPNNNTVADQKRSMSDLLIHIQQRLPELQEKYKQYGIPKKFAEVLELSAKEIGIGETQEE